MHGPAHDEFHSIDEHGERLDLGDEDLQGGGNHGNVLGYVGGAYGADGGGFGDGLGGSQGGGGFGGSQGDGGYYGNGMGGGEYNPQTHHHSVHNEPHYHKQNVYNEPHYHTHHHHYNPTFEHNDFLNIMITITLMITMNIIITNLTTSIMR